MPNIAVPQSVSLSPYGSSMTYSTNTGTFVDGGGHVWYAHELAAASLGNWSLIAAWLSTADIFARPAPPFMAYVDDDDAERFGSFTLQAVAESRASVIEINHGGTRRNALTLRTQPGDVDPFGSKNAQRTDVYLSQKDTDGYQGRSAWWAHSIMFPSESLFGSLTAPYIVPPGWGVAACFHNTASGPGQANFHVDADSNGLGFRGYGGPENGGGEFGRFIEPVRRGQWYNFVYNVLWSSGEDGFFDAWVNGVRRLRHRGATLYTGQGVYLKLSNYHTTTDGPTSIMHTRVIRAEGPEGLFLDPVSDL